MKKSQLIRSLFLLSSGWLALAAPAYGEAPHASAQEWGIYASLAGTTWRGGNRQGGNFGTNWRITVEWREAGVELIERWEPTDNQYRPMTHVITRGDRPGELRLAATNGVCANRTGTVRPDGSVLFVCNGFFKWPMHVVAPRDGVWEQHYVSLNGSEVAGIKDVWRFQSQSGVSANNPRVASSTAEQAPSRGAADAPAVPAAISASGDPATKAEEAGQAAGTAPAVAAAEPVSPLAADWGVYASIVGKDWRGASNVSIRWSKPGEEVIETWTYGAERGDYAGQQQLVARIRRGEKPGSLVLTLDREVAETRTLTGKIRADGSIQLLKPGLILDQRLYTMSLPSPSRLEHFLVPPGNTMRTTLYLAGSDDATRGGRQRPGETWGAYADLAGKHWLVDDTPSGDKLLFTFGWIVPGEAMYVRMHNLADDRVENHHVVRSPETGKLYAEPSLWGSWKAEVTLDGDRSITLETKGIFGWRMSFTRKADGGFEYYEGGSLYKAYTGSMVLVSDDETPRLIAAAKEAKAQREREERQRKRERREAFNTALTVVNSALVATNETLKQQAEADRQRLQRERERAAEALRQRAAAEERQRAADMERARQLQAQQDIERQQRAQQQTGQPQQGVQRNAGAQQMAQQQQQQQRRAEETRRREAAEAERKRQQDADTERRRREEAAQRQRADEAMLARSKQLEEALKQQEEEARNRPVAYREGITLCAPPQNGGKAWLCRGPLQNMSGVLDTQSGNVAVRQACGGNNVRDLGMVAGYRAYGCGFGIHPTDREYPGNRDIPASLGVNHIPDRGTFYCNPNTVFAYCKERR